MLLILGPQVLLGALGDNLMQTDEKCFLFFFKGCKKDAMIREVVRGGYGPPNIYALPCLENSGQLVR